MNPARSAVAAFDLPSPSTPAATPGNTPVPPLDFQRESRSKVIRPSTVELSVLTLGPASAVDVHIDMTNLANFTTGLVVRIYAWIGSNRTLVGRGRATTQKIGATGATAFSPLRQKRFVASARCAAERFEVTISGDIGVSFPASASEFPISAIAYQTNGSPALARPLHMIHNWTAAGVFLLHSDCELCAANGGNAEAAGTAARFLQVWDSVDVTLANVATSILLDELPIQPQQVWSIDYGDRPLETDRGLIIANSTTSGSFTANAAASGFLAYEVR